MRDLVYDGLQAFVLCVLVIVAWSICVSLSEAEAQNPKIVFLNKCADVDINNPDWRCLNKTQAAQSLEVKKQVNQACKRKHCPTIYSIDPKRNRGGDYLFGAWRTNGRVYFAAMPGCPNGRKALERLLR